MTAEEFRKRAIEKANQEKSEGPPATNAQEGLNILVDHFLGEDWYIVSPIHNTQVNTEAIYEILKKYPKKKTLKKFIKGLFKIK